MQLAVGLGQGLIPHRDAHHAGRQQGSPRLETAAQAGQQRRPIFRVHQAQPANTRENEVEAPYG